MIAAALFFGAAVLLTPMPVAASDGRETIERADIVEQLCRDSSEETLDELGITAEHWQAETLSDQGKFFIDGMWITNAGQYLVECQLHFGGRADQMQMQLLRERRDS